MFAEQLFDPHGNPKFDSSNSYGLNLLMVYAWYGFDYNEELLLKLISRTKTDVNACSNFGKTAFNLACFNPKMPV